MLLNLGRDSALLTLGLLLVHRDLLLDLLHLRLCLLVSVLESLVLRIDHASSLQFVLHHEVLCDKLLALQSALLLGHNGDLFRIPRLRVTAVAAADIRLLSDDA